MKKQNREIHGPTYVALTWKRSGYHCRLYSLFLRGRKVLARQSYLIEIGKGGDLIPQGLHDGSVLCQASLVDVALALDNGGTQSHALEVVVVQEAIVVQICRGEEKLSLINSVDRAIGRWCGVTQFMAVEHMLCSLQLYRLSGSL